MRRLRRWLDALGPAGVAGLGVFVFCLPFCRGAKRLWMFVAWIHLAIFAWGMLGFANVYTGIARRAYDLTVEDRKSTRLNSSH